MRTIDVIERRARLARRHRLAAGHRAGDVEQAAESMVCLHATDPATVYLSAWARVDGMAVPDMERALYDDRSLVKHLAMRRTLFVFPRATLSVAQAGASDRVADSERRRLIRDVEKAGLQKDGARWLKKASEQVLAALSDGREATSSELRDADPGARRLDRLRRGEVVGREGARRSAGADHAVRRRAHRAGIERWRVDDLTTPVGNDGVLARGGDRALHGRRRRGGTGRAMAARVRPRDARGHQVVARLDRRGREEGAGRPRRGRGRSRRPDRIRAARRPGVDRSGRAVGGAPAAARPDHDGLVRARLVPRSVQGAVVRHERQRRTHGVVERSDRGWLAPDRDRRGRPSAAGGHR